VQGATADMSGQASGAGNVGTIKEVSESGKSSVQTFADHGLDI